MSLFSFNPTDEADRQEAEEVIERYRELERDSTDDKDYDKINHICKTKSGTICVIAALHLAPDEAFSLKNIGDIIEEPFKTIWAWKRQLGRTCKKLSFEIITEVGGTGPVKFYKLKKNIHKMILQNIAKSFPDQQANAATRRLVDYHTDVD